MKTFYFTYQTKNLINNKVYIGIHKTNNLNDGYIGCGITRNTKSKNKTPFHKAVLKYGYENFKLEILCFFETYEQALEEEAFLVDENWVKSKDNYNVKTGGKQFKFTEEHFNNISEDIYQFNLNGELIKKWKSTTEIFNSLGFNKDCITECCRGSKKKYKNFQWSYNNECSPYKTKNFKNVHQYNLNGEYVNTFLNAKEAFESTGANQTAIIHCCNKSLRPNGKRRNKTVGGYIWSFDKVEDIVRHSSEN